ncbi:DUF58 domain-containing protein [Pigmentiphaga aceris]|uniref:DUF58 domain-containing protein n=1 Tax=Pigmentiphaga aceris TaxID=1940612 RepID=A0A5C0B4M7_9BURK|nr:DUF58 domain-containing protein [Pigmentiphaga aceris]QEI08210.1 DUF58 domain-containing protein [Pigmentiphaga aceris]
MFGRLLSKRRRTADALPVAAAAGSMPTTGPFAGGALASVNASHAEALLRRLEWTVVRRLDGLLQGDYRTLFRGFGLDLADLREYQPGDDVRHIDWNVTARLQTPYVREFQEDREVSAWFLLDLSGSIDFGSGTVTKRALLWDFTTVMAQLLTRYGNRVGAVLYGGDDKVSASVVPARSGRRHLLHLITRMHGTPAVSPSDTNLRDLLERARAVAKRRSVVFVVSDFISAPGWEASLGMLARRHDVVAVRLTDPLEHTLPDLGLVVLQDAETGEQMFVDTHDPAFRERFTAAAKTRETDLARVFAQTGVACLNLSTDTRLDLALLNFAHRRRQQGSGKPGVEQQAVGQQGASQHKTKPDPAANAHITSAGQRTSHKTGTAKGTA